MGGRLVGIKPVGSWPGDTAPYAIDSGGRCMEEKADDVDGRCEAWFPR